MLTSKLDDKHISYTVFDNAVEMLKMGITTVPILDVDGQLMDFNSAVKWVNEQ